jgi:hypothetical protein
MVHVEALIYKTYIIKRILIFISNYFKPHMRTRIICIPRYDDRGGEVISSGNWSIFSHPRYDC